MADRFECTLVWLSDDALLAGVPYLMQLGPASAGVAVTQVRHRFDVNTLQPLAAHTLTLNQIGVCEIALDRRVAFDAYRDNHHTGGFIVIDRSTQQTVAAPRTCAAWPKWQR